MGISAIMTEVDASWVKIVSTKTTIYQQLAKMLTVEVEGAQYTRVFQEGFWDGKYKFYKILKKKNEPLEGMLIPRGAVERLLPYFNNEIDTSQIVHRTEQLSELETFLEQEEKDLPYKLHSFQRQAFLELLQKERGIGVLCTGSGKSLLIYLMLLYFTTKYPEKKTLMIVPNISLLEQMKSDFETYGNKFSVGLNGGGYKPNGELIENVTISTFQSAENLPLQEFDIILCDETHRATADTYLKGIFPKALKAYNRYGLSGTLSKNMKDKLVTLGTFGNHKKYVTPRELINYGLGTPLQVISVGIDYRDTNIITNISRKSFIEQTKFLTELDIRNIYIADYIRRNIKGNTIVLFNYIKHGEQLLSNYVDEFKGFDHYRDLNDENIHFITGTVNGKIREKIRTSFESADNKILFGTSSILSTGINIPKLKNIVFALAGKSFIQINQSIGRLLRLHPSKNVVNLYDFYDNVMMKPNKGCYSLRHFKERVKIYKENEYPITNFEVKI